jgi:hypothetical protein
MGGPPGYGYRRRMVSAEGKLKEVLKGGEQKSLKTDRITLVLGPPKEEMHLALISCLSRVQSKTRSEINPSMMLQQTLLASFPPRLVILGQRNRSWASISLS